MLHLALVGSWVVIALGFWRTLMGHFAWRIHEGATRQRRDTPELEDYFGAAIITAIPAILWPLVLLIFVPWPWRTKLEVEGVKKAQAAHVQRMMLENEKRAKQLNLGNHERIING